MSEMAECFAGMKKASQERRASNRDQSAAVLERSGIAFDSKNGGAHLIVYVGPAVVDFWPGTGLWIVRGGNGNARRRGVRQLVRFVQEREGRDGKQVCKGG